MATSFTLLFINHIMISKPKNIAAPAMFPFAGSFVGISSSINIKVLKMQHHRGRSVCPVTTAMNRQPANTASAKYPTIIVEIVFF